MMCSGYTIDVAPCNADGQRVVFVKRRGQTVFSVTHRDVRWAFLAHFDAFGGVSKGQPLDCTCEWNSADGIEGADAMRRDVTRDSTEEYLCVFHREELADGYGRLSLAQPLTLCTAYTVHSARFTEFALHNILPSFATPGLLGVFVHGAVQTARCAMSPPLMIAGVVHRPAMDVWWMASPLVVRPVYVHPDLVIGDYGDGEQGGGCRGDVASMQRDTPGTFNMDSGVAAGSAKAYRVGLSPLSVQGRCGVGGATGVTACSGVMLDAVVLLQFAVGRCDSGSALTLVRMHDGALGLASTTPYSAMDVITWRWWPQRLFLPELGTSHTALSVTVSAHVSMSRPIVFLHDRQTGMLHVLRAPDIYTARGALERLWSVHPTANCCAVVLPCVRPRTPQPIALLNVPAVGQAALYTPVTLQAVQAGSATAAECCLAVLPLECVCVPNACSAKRDMAGGTEGAQMRDADTPRGAKACPLRDKDARVTGLLSQQGTTLVVQCHGSAATPSTTTLSHAQRRRCETTDTATLSFPSLTVSLPHPMFDLVLDALAGAVGDACVYGVEYELVRRAWAARSRGVSFDYARGLRDALLDIVQNSVLAASHTADRCETACEPLACMTPSQKLVHEQLFVCFSDPLQLRAGAVDALCDESSRTSYSATHGGAQARCPQWPIKTCELGLLALHLLCESCQLQERWWALLDYLADLNARLSQLLRWPRYVRLYEALLPASVFGTDGTAGTKGCVEGTSALDASCGVNGRGETCDEAAARVNLSPDDLRQHFDFSTGHAKDEATSAERGLLAGQPPSLLRSLQSVLRQQGSTSAAGASEREGAWWPALRLQDDACAGHPIALANAIYALYVSSLATLRPSVQNDDEKGVGPRWWDEVCRGVLRHALSARCVQEELCVGAAYPVLLALAKGRECPCPGWQDALHAVVGRLDKVTNAKLLATLTDPGRDVVRVAEERAVGYQYRATLMDDDGVNLRPGFARMWRDARLDGVQAMFNTAAYIALPGHGDGGEVLRGELDRVARRAMALPVGRGLFTMCTQDFRIRDSIPVPRLNLDGRTADGIIVTNTSTEVISEHFMWPIFHNGAAAGLRFLPLAASTCPASSSSAQPAAEPVITRHWIVYQTRQVGSPAARAGLLLAAGLLGHLRVLQLTDIYTLLVTPQAQYIWREATTIAVMLGLSCSFRGTNNNLIFRCLSMHIQSLTPSAEDIEVSLDVQTAALVSIGLLCQQSPTNTFLVELFLNEMSRLPSDEHCTHREGYALGAGIGLGLLLLGLGRGHGLLNVEDRLLSFMTGARRTPGAAAAYATREGLEDFYETKGGEAGHFLTRALLTHNVRQTLVGSCTKVYEGVHYNAAVTSPAAVMALGLMYLQTGDAAMAAKLAVPDRLTGLQGLSPLLCLLRSTMCCLVHWASVRPRRDWLYAQLPSCLLRFARADEDCGADLATQQVHYLLMNLGHCIAGTVVALGLRFAGSMNTDARDVVLRELRGFMRGQIGSSAIAIPALQRSTGAYTVCLSSCGLALSLIMAGTGDLKVLALLRRLYRRGGVSYGVHMATSMALGLLFLGGGRLTLANSPEAIAALLIALYPAWPRDAGDNVAHLQALRHLSALCVVPRVLETVDALSSRAVSVPVRVVLRRETSDADSSDNDCNDGKDEDDAVAAARGATVGGASSGAKDGRPICETPRAAATGVQEVMWLRTPCLYPPPALIERLEVHSTRHYPLCLDCAGRGDGGGDARLTDDGLVVRVLARRAEQAHTPCVALSDSCEMPIAATARERQLLDWLRCLFSRRATSPVAARAILDNVRLVRLAQGVLPGDVVSGDVLCSCDFGRALEQTLERRYKALFLHGRNATVDAPTHPLHQLIMLRRPWGVVVRGVALHPGGTASFPCDFTALASPLTATAGSGDAEERQRCRSHSMADVHCYDGGVAARWAACAHTASPQAAETRSEGCALQATDVCAVARWFAEALHFYGLDGDTEQIRRALIAHAASLRDARRRTVTLLLLARHLALRVTIVEQLVVCCIDCSMADLDR